MYRKNLLKGVILRRFAVTLKDVDSTFMGLLSQFDTDVFVFEDCRTVATKDGETTQKIPGRVFVDRNTVSYLQELP